MNRRFFLKFSTSSLLVGSSKLLMAMPEPDSDLYIKDQLSLRYNQCESMSNEILHKKDVVASAEERLLLHSVSIKLKKTQRYVGHGNFNILSFDEFVYLAKHRSSISALTKDELKYIEKIFYTQASEYGFYGEKVTHELNDKISKKDTVKIPYTGHFLYKGEPHELYNRLEKELGSHVVLTSGVRSVVKQLDLFLYKANKLNGNYSKAAHSLAPPGYSFHGISDFDVGKRGFGYRNFTSAFAKTKEYKDLQKLGYINIRYPQNNPFGVRFEPWHIKV